jgi:uncharacterized protein (DUF4415 family)
MRKKKSAGASTSGTNTWVDPDDAPELTDSHFEHADVYEGDTLVRAGRGPGRPKLAAAKVAVSLRVDPAVLDYFRSTGPGWQTRMNDVLQRAARRKSKPAPAGRSAAPRKAPETTPTAPRPSARLSRRRG